MTKMHLTMPKEIRMLAIDEYEAMRLYEAAMAGETLYYRDDEGGLMLEDGVLYVKGYEHVPILFGVYNSQKRTIHLHAEAVQPLKDLVKKVVVSDGAKRMATCFCNFTSLREAILPDSVEWMYNVFEDCPKLMPYPFPKSLKEISGAVFGIAPKELILPDGLETFDSAFSELPIRSVTLPKGLKEVPQYAFQNCRELESVTFGDSLTRIRHCAFSDCVKLKRVEFPQTLCYVGDFAFDSCKELAMPDIPEGCFVSSSAFNRTPLQEKMQIYRILATDPAAYTEDMGAIKGFEDLQSVLGGKSLKEQCAHYRVIVSSSVVTFSYGEEDGERGKDLGKSLLESADVERLILKDGLVVGVVSDGCNVLVGESVCTYYAVDEDGTGRSERTDYCTLIFTP